MAADSAKKKFAIIINLLCGWKKRSFETATQKKNV